MKSVHVLATAAALFGLTSVASAQVLASTTQTVTITVGDINTISVSGAASITLSTIGTTPNSATSYSISTNGTNRKITGQITGGDALVTGLTLAVALNATGVGTAANSGNPITLGSGEGPYTAQDLVTAISNKSESGKTITYSVTNTAAVGPQVVAPVITFTVQ
jgi:hypothetical protein